MNRRYMLLFAAALLVSAGAPLHAQAGDQPPAPPAPPTLARPLPPPAPTQALLRYKFAVGQILRYRTVADINMNITMPTQHQTIPIAQHIETVTRQTVLSVDPVKDTATMTVQIESMQGATNGQPMPPAELQKARRISATTLVLSSTGRIVSMKLSPGTKVGGFDPGKMNMFQQNGALPLRAVKPGDTWTSTVDVSSIGAKIASNFQLTDLTASDGAVIAQIQQTANGTIGSKTATALPGGMKLGGKIDMTGQLQFDVDAGSIKTQSSTAHFDATINTPAQAAAKPAVKKSAKKIAPPAPAMSTKVHFDMTSMMTRLDVPVTLPPPAPAAPVPAPAAPDAM